jgi:Fic family protein
MHDLLEQIADKKAQLDALRPMSGEALKGLQKFHDVELTYTSNAIEGNTLTYRETAEVIEHGITVGGKPLRDHLEALDHYEALQWMRDIAGQSIPLSEAIVRELHRRIVARSQPEIAGLYSRNPRRIAGSPVIFPNPVKIPGLMSAFGVWLEQTAPTTVTIFDAHYRLTAIHPFGDGNGRTARLLMNLMLIRGGYPPVAIRPEDRSSYLDGLERASLEDDPAPFQMFMHRRLDTTMGEYLGALREALPPEASET